VITNSSASDRLIIRSEPAVIDKSQFDSIAENLFVLGKNTSQPENHGFLFYILILLYSISLSKSLIPKVAGFTYTSLQGAHEVSLFQLSLEIAIWPLLGRCDSTFNIQLSSQLSRREDNWSIVRISVILITWVICFNICNVTMWLTDKTI
jgi:hypothetical protein